MTSIHPKFFVCSCIFLLSFLPSSGQWQWLNPKPSSYYNTKIVFADHQTGFVLNNKGDVYKTTNTGSSWELLKNFPKALCMDIAYSTGVVAGNNGMVYISTDNGSHWNRVNTNFSDAIETINIVSRDTIFVSNGYNGSFSNGNIYLTTDRGVTWVALHCNTSIHALKFVNSKVGFAGGPQSTILKTIDGGVTWQQKYQLNIFPSSITCMQFLDKDTGYAFQEYDSLLKTTDGGETWHSSDADYTMGAMHFVNSMDGYLGGDDGAMVATHDGGNTFTWIGFDGLRNGNTIYSVHFISRDTGFAVGLLGRIIKTTDAGLHWSAYDSSTYLPVTGISFGSATVAYATSWNYMYKTTDKGDSWNTLGLTVGTVYPSQSRFTHVRFTNEDTGFVLSSYPARLYYTVDGGGSWQSGSLPVPNPGYADYATDMHFINTHTGFISIYRNLNGGSVILKTMDGGLTWAQASSTTNTRVLSNIFFSSPDTGYAVNYSQILKTTDSSKTWAVIYQGDFTGFGSIVFTSAKDGFASSTDGSMFTTTDTGRTWNQVRLPTYSSGGIKTFDFYNQKVGYYTSGGLGPAPYGSLYQTIDSGKTWQLRKDFSANSIVFTPDSSVVFAGYGGLIVSSGVREVYADSIQFIKLQNDCNYILSAVVGAVVSRADSISFLVTSPGGNVYALQATPNTVDNGRITINASAIDLLKDTLYSITVRYFNNGVYSFTNSVDLKFTGNVNTWTGQINTTWENGLNWSCGHVPDGNTDVSIPSFSLRYPVINSNAFCRSLKVSPGATVKVNEGFKLTVTRSR